MATDRATDRAVTFGSREEMLEMARPFAADPAKARDPLAAQIIADLLELLPQTPQGTEPRPMDPERLRWLQRIAAGAAIFEADVLELPDALGELLDEREGLIADLRGKDAFIERSERFREAAEAEVTRLRSRVRVEVSDVERAGVTKAHVEAWLRANGWDGDNGRRKGHTDDGVFCNWLRKPHPNSSPDAVSIFERHIPGRITQTIATLARHHGRAGLDILEEMARMEVEP